MPFGHAQPLLQHSLSFNHDVVMRQQIMLRHGQHRSLCKLSRELYRRLTPTLTLGLYSVPAVSIVCNRVHSPPGCCTRCLIVPVKNMGLGLQVLPDTEMVLLSDLSELGESSSAEEPEQPKPRRQRRQNKQRRRVGSAAALSDLAGVMRIK